MIKLIVFFSVIQIILGAPSKSLITYAKQGQTPWTVLIHIGENRCTGSLIKDNFVVTAAHCFDQQEGDENELRLEDVKIFIGELDITKDPDCNDDDDNDDDDDDDAECVSESVAEIPPKSLAVHELYKDAKGVKNYAYDIAIITLKRPPRKSEIIKNIELPEESQCKEKTFKAMSTTNSGFGEIKHKQYTDIKKITQVNILSDETKCKNDLKEKFNEYKHFCGKSPIGITTCKGDSGGPLSQKIDEVDTLVGIVSFGTSECSVSDQASAFVKVDCLIDWINEITTGKKRKVTTEMTTTTTTTEKTEAEEGGDDEDDDIFG